MSRRSPVSIAPSRSTGSLPMPITPADSLFSIFGKLRRLSIATIGALALDPKNGATLYNRGIALAEVGRDAEAIASFEAAVGIMPDRERLVLARRAAPLFDTRKLTTARTQ